MSLDDQVWRQIVDDHRVRPRELLRSERDLAADPPAALPPKTVETFVARVGQPTAHIGSPPWRRLAAATLLVGASLAMAAVGARIVWPQQRATPYTMDHATAMVTSETATAAADRFAALALLDDHCLAATQLLSRLSQHADARVADAAAAARGDLLALLRGTAAALPTNEAPTGSAVHDVPEATRVAGDEAAAVPVRLDAIAQLRNRLVPALVRLRDSTFVDEQLERKRERMVARLVRRLDNAISR